MADPAPYLAALLAHARSPIERLTVPGHKGGAAAPGATRDAFGAAVALDVPLLLEGLDLPLADDPDGEEPPLAAAERLATEAWGAARTWFLTAGATQGNLAACLAVAAGGAPVLVQRSAHTSTFNGLVLAGAEVVTVMPEIDHRRGIAHAVTPAALEVALVQSPGVRAVLLTSPTYHGTAADLRSLVRVAHRRGVAVVVDEAWGPHLPFSPDVPVDALSAGADLVVSSTHKHLGSLGGSAMLHLGRGAPHWLDAAAVERALALVTSTSPSSLLLASLDAARARAEACGAELLAQAVDEVRVLRATISAIPGFSALGEEQVGRHGVVGIDPLRLTVDVRRSGWTGQEVAAFARAEHDLELELAQPATVVACFGLGEAIAPRGDRLVRALEELAATRRPAREPSAPPPLTLALDYGSTRAARPSTHRMGEALWADHAVVPLGAAAGRIAGEALVPYPPGIPLVLPGERISPAAVGAIEQWIAAGGAMRGLADPLGATVRVVREPRAVVAVAAARAAARDAALGAGPLPVGAP